MPWPTTCSVDSQFPSFLLKPRNWGLPKAQGPKPFPKATENTGLGSHLPVLLAICFLPKHTSVPLVGRLSQVWSPTPHPLYAMIEDKSWSQGTSLSHSSKFHSSNQSEERKTQPQQKAHSHRWKDRSSWSQWLGRSDGLWGTGNRRGTQSLPT